MTWDVTSVCEALECGGLTPLSNPREIDPQKIEEPVIATEDQEQPTKLWTVFG